MYISAAFESVFDAVQQTNAIESLNSVIRKVLKKRKLFPTDDSAMKVILSNCTK